MIASIKSTIWPIEPHTQAKHAILNKYLAAWLPIITRWNGKVVYVDGFAGPGEYIGGEDGSPIIAIKSVLEHKFNIGSEIRMLFVEADNRRYNFLRKKLSSIKIPSNLKIECKCNKFAVVLNQILNSLDGQKKRLAPSFVFMDPFGFKGIPLHLIKRIMENPRCEVLITFMYEEMNRFLGKTNLRNCFNETFGTDKWKVVLSEQSPERKEKMLHEIYKEQLEYEANIQFVRSFKMVNKINKTDYFLFFGTNNIVGLKKMKAAMWNVDEQGLFEFSDATYNLFQPTLFKKKPDYYTLKKIIIKNFKGKSITVEELENFIVTQTPFRETHFKRQILLPMEEQKPSQIKVICQKRRKGTFPTRCTIKFL